MLGVSDCIGSLHLARRTRADQMAGEEASRLNCCAPGITSDRILRSKREGARERLSDND
jgi:hypothetical protein